MSHNWSSLARSLPSRRLHVRLRLKVMAGVVVVTLIALAAFDVGVVTTLRRYLLTQTDNNLQLALTVTEPRLNSLLPEGFPSPWRLPPGDRQLSRPASELRGFFGDFEIAFVPLRGPVVTLQMGETAVGSQQSQQWAFMPPGNVRSVARPGPHTVPVGGRRSASGRPGSGEVGWSPAPAFTRSRRPPARSRPSSPSVRSW